MEKYFKALNDSTRREILEILRLGEMSAGEISERFNMSKPSISHHLDLLRQADLVSSKKKGQFVIYAIIGLDSLSLKPLKNHASGFLWGRIDL